MAGLIARILSPLLKGGEGQWRPGPYPLPITGGWLPHDVGQYANWWQLGYNPSGGYQSAMVEACISAYSQTVAMCPGDHWRATAKGGRERVTTSALSRLLRSPNAYQSPSDFMLNATRSLYAQGNAYALALRNDRFEIDELHLMQPQLCAAQVAETGDVFYRLAGNDVIDQQVGGAELLVPARDVLHIRLHAKRAYPYPLVGETPLQAAAADIAMSNAIAAQQIQFYMNLARPSAVLSTDLVLDKNQVAFIRDRWNEQSKGIHAGGVPILTAGLKPHFLSLPSKDAELAEIMKLTDQKIALAFRMPLQILGLGGTPYSSTEAMMQSWIATGLGFALNHIEDAFGLLFGLKGQPDEYVEFDTKALLRSAFKDRIEGLVRAVQGGVLSPNEARNQEDYDSVEFGDEPRVQQQVVPLSAAGKIPASPAAPGSPPAGGQPAPGGDKPGELEPPKDEPARSYADEVASELRTLNAIADRHERSAAA